MDVRYALLLCAAVPLAAAEPPVDFGRDVRPILSDRCFSCHGPDEAKRQAGMRLDLEDGAKKARGAHIPVVPGNPAASEVIKRVSAEKPAMRMPPPYSDRKPLSEKEVATLRAWIQQGAKWQSHWSFTPPVRPELPVVRNRSWVRNPIDNFVLARLEREHLTPSPDTARAQKTAGPPWAALQRDASPCYCSALESDVFSLLKRQGENHKSVSSFPLPPKECTDGPAPQID